ncbi:MAG TPA: N-acetylmuramoyl-L-alanine amidase [Gemmatimonadaceae bacterium]|nr:N-acetylmuramoyl-L-alanine amidase [Gemmatimonadaceae bacterium]
MTTQEKVRPDVETAESGCLYDGSVEIQELTEAELKKAEQAAEAGGRSVAARRFKVVTKIRSQNWSRDRKMHAPFGITLHHTGGSFAGDLATLTKPASNPRYSVSANDYVTKKGVIYELCEFPKRAWHAGDASWKGITDGNSHFWGIEIENRGTPSDPYPKEQIDAVVWRCRQIRKKLGIKSPDMLTRHRDICMPRGRKADTSDRFPWKEVRKRVFAAHDPTDDDAKPKPPKPPKPPAKVSAKSALLAEPRATADQAYAAIVAKPNGEYTDKDVRTIVDAYWKEAPRVGLDPLVMVAQMAHETAYLSSHWAARPRRNPAGIGVTGEPGKGVSFPSWSKAVRAHLGRVLAYAIPKGKENAAQKKLIAEALEWRALPDTYRGVAPRLGDLTKKWATDPKYGASISRLANQIAKG